MTNNREKRVYQDTIHMFLALQRTSKQGNKNCIRQVIKEEELDLQMLEAKVKVIGGEWRIHKTVNARDVEKTRKWLIKHLIDTPQNACFVDTAWRTALLQKECKAEKKFMLDVDTQDQDKLIIINRILDKHAQEHFRVKSPNGYHIITNRFDTRTICELDYVTILPDGYYYIKTVGDKNV